MSAPLSPPTVDTIVIDAATVPSALRRLRRHAQISATELGRKAGFSQSKISRIENGHTRASVDDLRDLAIALELPDETAARLIAFAQDEQDASAAELQSSQGSDPRIERGEQAAVRRSTYSPFFVPPILQLPLYTKALLVKLESIHQRSTDITTQAMIRAAVEERARRQLVLEDGQPYEVYLRARSLAPSWASPLVTNLQLDHIENILRHTNVAIFLVGDKIDDAVPGLEEFTLLEFGADRGSAVISESYSGPTYLDSQPVVDRYRDMLSTVAKLSQPYESTAAQWTA